MVTGAVTRLARWYILSLFERSASTIANVLAHRFFFSLPLPTGRARFFCLHSFRCSNFGAKTWHFLALCGYCLILGSTRGTRASCRFLLPTELRCCGKTAIPDGGVKLIYSARGFVCSSPPNFLRRGSRRVESRPGFLANPIIPTFPLPNTAVRFTWRVCAIPG